MTNVVNIHASCVLLAQMGAGFGAARDAGVLLLGKSGSGKSDLALRMLTRGAILVSDDRTELCAQGGHLVARPPAELRGLIEARGLGIVELSHAHKARVALAVALDKEPERHPEREDYDMPWDLPVRVPLLRLHAFESSAPEKIALAVAAFERNLFRGGA